MAAAAAQTAGSAPRIRALTQDVAGRIKAGSCIATVAHAVQELIHNSLDAKATTIRVAVDTASFTIDVQDDGCGISAADLAFLGEFHVTSTSKGSRDTLYGYRGQTLVALAHMATVTVSSKPAGAGTEVTTRCLRELVPCDTLTDIHVSGHGTRVVAHGLFANWPVRQRSTNWHREMAAVVSFVTALALVFPHVSWSLMDVHSSTTMLRAPGCGTVQQRWTQLAACRAGPSTSVQGSCGFTQVTGVTGWTSEPQPVQAVCVNGRIVGKSERLARTIMALLRSAAGDQTFKARHPAFFIHVSCPVEICDMVRLDDSCLVMVQFTNWPQVDTALQQALQPHSLSGPRRPLVDVVAPVAAVDDIPARIDLSCALDRFRSSRAPYEAASPRRPQRFCRAKLDTVLSKHGAVCGAAAVNPTLSLPPVTVSVAAIVSRDSLAQFSVVSQVDSKFIVITSGDRLLAVDQHAADERIRLEALEASLFGPDGTARFGLEPCRPPVQCSLTLQQLRTLGAHASAIACWNYNVRCDAPPSGSVLSSSPLVATVTHTPKLFGETLPVSSLPEYLDALQVSPGCRPPVVTRLLHSKACRGAIMFGDPLSHAECVELVSKLARCSFPFQCAHDLPPAPAKAKSTIPSWLSSIECVHAADSPSVS